jgi:F-type H+-transporting ATPase subunit epsilon
MGLTLNLVTPTKKLVVDQEVDAIRVPGFRGELDILEGHVALVTTLSTGVLQYKLKGSNTFKKAIISWGYLEVVDNQVIILAETAETPEEIDLQRAKIALEKSEQMIKNAEDLEKYSRKLERAKMRIDMVQDTSKTVH